MAAEDLDRLPDRFRLEPARQAEWQDLAAAVRRAVEEELTERQRQVFVALALNGVPLDALAAELGSARNASTRRCSMPGVSCGRLLPLTGTWTMALRGAHEPMAGAGALPVD